MPNPATEAVADNPVNPIISEGDIDPIEDVEDNPVNPMTSAGAKDPTEDVVDNPVNVKIGFEV